MRRWSEPVDLHLLLSQSKYNLSLGVVVKHVVSAAYDMVAQCGAPGGQPKFDIYLDHTRLKYCLHARGWSEPVDLPLLLSQTKYNRSLAADEADVDSAPHNMVAQCWAGGKLKFDLFSTQSWL